MTFSDANLVEKRRLDVEMVQRGLIKSREKAKALISEGFVSVNGKIATKPSVEVSAEDDIVLTGDLGYVGRGGKKLEKALSAFMIDPKDRTAIDIGASTGGFTDCLLRNGAKKVYAVDVGSGQLDESLINDPRVVNMEKTDVRSLGSDSFVYGVPDIAVIDVSFISLTKILPFLKTLLSEDSDIIALLKPQFEAGKTKKGIVSSPDVHVDVILSVTSFAESNGFCVKGLDFSPVKGGDGNIEFLLCLTFGHGMGKFTRKEIKELVKVAHNSLKK